MRAISCSENLYANRNRRGEENSRLRWCRFRYSIRLYDYNVSDMDNAFSRVSTPALHASRLTRQRERAVAHTWPHPGWVQSKLSFSFPSRPRPLPPPLAPPPPVDAPAGLGPEPAGLTCGISNMDSSYIAIVGALSRVWAADSAAKAVDEGMDDLHRAGLFGFSRSRERCCASFPPLLSSANRDMCALVSTPGSAETAVCCFGVSTSVVWTSSV